MKYILVEENNVLTERRTFNQLGVVVSTPHMAMKFLAVNDTIITKRRTIFFLTICSIKDILQEIGSKIQHLRDFERIGAILKKEI